MTLKTLLEKLSAGTEIEIVETDTYNTLYAGASDRVFCRNDRKSWKKFKVEFLTPRDHNLYIEVATD